MPYITLKTLCCVLFLCSCGCMWHIALAKQKFCGKALDEAMDLVCVHGYNIKLAGSPQKRLMDMTENTHQIGTHIPYPKPIYVVKEEFEDGTHSMQQDVTVNGDTAAAKLPLSTYSFGVAYKLSPFLTGFYGNLLVRSSRDHGVYDECCRQPCSYSELSAYCRST